MKRRVGMKLKNVIALCAAALLLLGVRSLSSPLRAQNQQREHLRLLRALLPGSERFVRLDAAFLRDEGVISVHEGEGGFVVETLTPGYVGDVRMLVGVNRAGRVSGLAVREMEETPGVGGRALRDPAFLAQFLNTDGSAALAETDAQSSATADAQSSGAQGEIDAFSGATVSSRAAIRSVQLAVRAAKALGG